MLILFCRLKHNLSLGLLGSGRIQASEILLGYLLFIGFDTFVYLHLSLTQDLKVRVVSPELHIVDRHVTLETCYFVKNSKVFLADFRTEALLDGLSEYEVLDIVFLIFL